MLTIKKLARSLRILEQLYQILKPSKIKSLALVKIAYHILQKDAGMISKALIPAFSTLKIL